jgi:hypothetical protein
VSTGQQRLAILIRCIRIRVERATWPRLERLTSLRYRIIQCTFVNMAFWCITPIAALVPITWWVWIYIIHSCHTVLVCDEPVICRFYEIIGYADFIGWKISWQPNVGIQLYGRVHFFVYHTFSLFNVNALCCTMLHCKIRIVYKYKEKEKEQHAINQHTNVSILCIIQAWWTGVRDVSRNATTRWLDQEMQTQMLCFCVQQASWRIRASFDLHSKR